ncbi:VWA domain-containing protein, partial [Sulfurimonas sp. SAG-AH-194-I05]|nr:VWA domain-containing protein [Sulfurimonas sp. SAG-AH-194-I05]
MSFLHSEYFYYMLPPLFLFFGFLFFRKNTTAHYFSEEVMRKLHVNSHSFTLKRRNILFFFIGLFMIIGLAEPVIKDGVIQVKAKSADIMIALDISDSMLATDVYPNRLKLAKKKAMDLLKIAPNERIGVVAFAKNSYLVSPLSFDHEAVGFLLRQLNTDSITEKGTDFLALLNTVKSSSKSEAKKYLLLLSDGGDKDDFSEEIAYAKENAIVVFVLGLGTVKGSPIKKKDGTFIKYKDEIIVSKLNKNIADLATLSGGVYIESVKSDKDIKRMLSEIESKSDQKELKSEEIEKFIPLFYYPVALSIFLLLIALSSFPQRKIVSYLFILLFVTNPHAEAGVLDFLKLKEAAIAYKNGDYNTSQQIYTNYAKDTQNLQSHYNEGNSLYKQKKYKEAIEAYEKINFENNVSQANNLANIGNAHVKGGGEKSLEKAILLYEESLKLNEDIEVRENLEAVK